MVKELTLRDGTAAMIWALSPDDAPALQEAYGQLTPESRYRRFLSAPPTLSDRVLHVLVDHVDGVHHVALVLSTFTDDGSDRAVGVGRIVRYPDCPTVADVAVTVSDEWHGRGVATALLAELVEQRPPGVTELLTEVASENRASLAMLARLGRMRTTPGGPGVLEVRVHLAAATRAPG